MILDGFRLRNIEKKTKKNLEVFEKEFKGEVRKVNTVVIFVYELKIEFDLEGFLELFNFKMENVQVVTFCDSQKKEHYSELIVEKKDFGLFGGFKNHNVKTLLSSETDLIVNYVKNNGYLDNLIAQSETTFKVGFHNKNERLYDLMIDVGADEIELFNKELKRYLEILNKI